MTRVSLLPHSTARRGVRAGPWTTPVGDAEVDVTTSPPPWEPGTPIVLHSELVVDPEHVREACGLAPTDELVALARWSCAATDARGVSERVLLREPGAAALALVIDPDLALGRVTLSRAVLLGSSAPPRARTAAHREGSYLWRESPSEVTTVEIGPPRHRITAEVVDFRDLPHLDPAAAWAVDLALDDLDAPAEGTLRVLLNARHRAVAAMLGDTDEQSSSLRSVLRWDVGRELVRRALADDGLVDGADHAAGSLGEALQELLRATVPDLGAGELRAMRDERPAALDALLQARLGLWDER